MMKTTNAFSILSLLCMVLISPPYGDIVNGDFEAGNVGFNSDYIFQPGSNTGAAQYTISSNPNNWNFFFGSFGDNTTGSGLMMVVNGSTNSSDRFWIQNLSLTANQEYAFRMFATNAFDGEPALLALDLNGTLIDSFDLSGNNVGDWVIFETTFTPTSNGIMELSLRNLNTALGGNDFAMNGLRPRLLTDSGVFSLIGLQAVNPCQMHLTQIRMTRHHRCHKLHTSL